MERIFYKTDLFDEPQKVPIYIFDTTFLPHPDNINYEEFIPTLMTKLPKSPYTLIMFSNGLNKISWIWGLKFIKKFLINEENLSNLNKILMIHESWFIKTITSILNNYNSTMKNLNVLNKMMEKNFSLMDFSNNNKPNNGIHNNNGVTISGGLIINCNDLIELNQYVDITRLKISLNVYKHDYQLTNQDNLKFFTDLNFNINKINPIQVNEIFKYHFYQIFDIIYNFGDKVELIFHKPGNKMNSEIFINCIKRDQLLWINDWDLYCIATSFKKLINELPPLISIDQIALPIKDENLPNNLNQILNSLNDDLRLVFIKLFKLFNKLVMNPKTKLNSKILSKTFILVLSHETYLKANEPNLIILNNFIKKLIDNWSQYNTDTLQNTETPVSYNTNCDDVRVENTSNHKGLASSKYNINNVENIENDSNHNKNAYAEYDIIDASPKKVLSNNDNILNSPEFSACDINSPSPTKSSPLKNIPHIPSIKNFQSLNNPMSPIRLSPTKSMHSVKGSHSPIKPSKLNFDSLKDNNINNNDNGKISIQFPPQKYSFNDKSKSKSLKEPPTNPAINVTQQNLTLKPKPVIRGIKVGELAKLYEERAQGIELLKSL